MKLVTFTHPETGRDPARRPAPELDCRPVRRAVLQLRRRRRAAARAAAEAPRDMLTLLGSGALTSGALDRALELADNAAQAGDALAPGRTARPGSSSSSAATLLAPVPRPPRIRDYLTYEAHMAGAGLQVPPAFAAMPIC